MSDDRPAASPQEWTRSSFCADQACVEVASLDGGDVGIRDSKNPTQPHLQVSRDDWRAFLDEVQAGDFRNV